MTIFKLPASFGMAKSTGRPVWVWNDEWISNGHFMVKRRLIKEVDRLLVVAGKLDTFERVLATCKPEKQYSITENIEASATFSKDLLYRRIFAAADGERVCIAEKYVQHFEIECVAGVDAFHPLQALCGDLIIMPCSPPEKKKGA